ncbi:helicase/relaxase domain-containing protein [Sulfuritalea sp.]|uniref:helicase/relaxase domain-containing protein n=1 Tax=Sulfuritalea sp. TaxID=2480090 RepID=UPI001ACD1329|nr:helicase/relaxase domain-containing protein [Sulfuritalea sp.]MBN8476966.1 helicase/relaxase domain-containing protein [Sulfuritalea sp.]
MMIKWVMRREGRSEPASAFARTGSSILRRPLPANTPQCLQDEALVDLIQIKMGFPREVFEPVVRPVIEGYAAFVYRLPATESRPEAATSARFTHALQVGSRALDFRRGQILPRGAAPEVIGAQAHRWTYAVFVAALLHDTRHEGLAEQLLNRFVPPLVLEWLAADPALMRELVTFLSGDDSAPTGAISDLVRRAAGQSPSRDLRPSGRGDPKVQVAVPAPSPLGVKAEGDVEGSAAASNPTVATDPPALPVEETEYLEAVDDGQTEPASPPSPKFKMADCGLVQAPDTAHRFMAWLQQGLADGTLPVNVAGALVHFVPEGMLLVSPRIFREFATRFGDDSNGPASAVGDPDIGKSIQRQFLRAGWHRRAGKGVNILSYQVMRGERAVSQLSGVVIPNPERFIHPVPAINPLLVHLPAKEGEA